VASVVLHSIAFQYFPASTQSRVIANIEAVGRSATDQAPLAWLSFEAKPEGPAELRLRLWPHGEDIVLALADPHVREVRWLAPDV
jgi:hypothetical protein